MRAARYITALCSGGLALLAAGFVLGQHTAPTDYHLISEEVLATIDLAKDHLRPGPADPLPPQPGHG
jgi:hypothetical protein